MVILILVDIPQMMPEIAPTIAENAGSGNSGAPGRINYAIVGDTVNTANRLEQLCKEVCAGSPEPSILVSDATAAALRPGFAPTSVGEHRLRGRHETVEVYRLL